MVRNKPQQVIVRLCYNKYSTLTTHLNVNRKATKVNVLPQYGTSIASCLITVPNILLLVASIVTYKGLLQT